VQELFLELPAAWKANDRLCVAAIHEYMRAPLAEIALANTGLPARVHPRRAEAFRFGRFLLEQLGFNPSPAHGSHGTQGSWPNFAGLLRDDPPFRAMLEALPGSEALAACEMLDPQGVSSLVDLHLAKQQNCTYLLMMLLAIDSWIRQHGADGAR
jgi:hypothetical protein